MKKYIYLKVGDVIKKDDEYCNSLKTGIWFSINTFPSCFGGKIIATAASIWRRKQKRNKFDSDEQPNWQ